MSREYIDREAVMKEIAELFHETDPNGEEQVGFLKCHRIIRSAPAVDVAPAVHGEWIICSDGYFPYCSECKDEPENGKMTKFCANCGAKMDKGKGV